MTIEQYIQLTKDYLKLERKIEEQFGNHYVQDRSELRTCFYNTTLKDLDQIGKKLSEIGKHDSRFKEVILPLCKEWVNKRLNASTFGLSSTNPEPNRLAESKFYEQAQVFYQKHKVQMDSSLTFELMEKKFELRDYVMDEIKKNLAKGIEERICVENIIKGLKIATSDPNGDDPKVNDLRQRIGGEWLKKVKAGFKHEPPKPVTPVTISPRKQDAKKEAPVKKTPASPKSPKNKGRAQFE